MATGPIVNKGLDLSVYNPPGVYTEAIDGPQLAVNSSMPTAVALFGAASGYRTHIETVKINPDTLDDDDHDIPAQNRTLDKKGIDTDSLTVSNPNTGKVYAKDTDYTIVFVGGEIGTPTAEHTISRVIDGGSIEPDDRVRVSYRYTDKNYFEPKTFYDYDDVKETYGEPFDKETGDVASELTLGAKFAFLNGANRVICVPVEAADPEAPHIDEYFEALDKLSDLHDVAVVVPCSGRMELHELVRQHVNVESGKRFERRAIVGFEGAKSFEDRKVAAESITDRRVCLVSPGKFIYYSEELGAEIDLGGQFMAATLAGMTVAMSFAQPLTHKRITGWRDVDQKIRDGQKTQESENGLLVVEKTRRQLLQVRHGVTTDPTDLISREWSIIGQQDALTYRIRDYLEAANLIGQPIYPYTLINVKSSAEAALQSLIRDALLVDYTGLKVRQLLLNPDVIEVKFSWLPAFPLNYIIVRFGISLMSGEVSSIGDTANQGNISQGQSSQPGNSRSGSITPPQQNITGDYGGDDNTLQGV